jgi:GTP-binding protein HflX
VYEIERAQGVALEAAILVRVVLPADPEQEDPLLELEGLARTAGTHVVSGIVQRRRKPDKATYLGKGKLEELQLLVDSHDADVVIFDNDLSPAQIRNLEQALERKVLDRTELILDIFASSARTREARLAVELAQLEYSLPRLKHMWTHLSRMKMGVGMRGPGEKQLEVDRRLVEKRIVDLRRELKVIEGRKERQVSSRNDLMTVSLIGYTNAGKSTLMNLLTGAGVIVADKLFATLDTRTRRWQLPNWGPVLLSDTVDFIRNLPHRLIASFKATLEETRQAELLIHVADGSSPEVFEQVSAVYDVLKEIGIEEKNTLLVINKIDQLESELQIASLLDRYPQAIPISAHTEQGIEKLAMAVSDALSRSFQDVLVETGVSNGRLMAYLSAHGEVLSTRYNETTVTIHCRLAQQHLGRIDTSEATITLCNGDGQAEALKLDSLGSS